MYVGVLILGMILLAIGAQGAVRLLLDADDAGLLSWLPVGFAGQLVAYIALAAVGVALAAWGSNRARSRGQLS